MKYRRLGKSNLRVSAIGMGTWQFGGEWGKDFRQDEVDRIFDAASEAGINLIDTAECYGDHASEAFIGNAMKRDRQKWIVATKFGHKFHGHLNRTDERSARQVAVQIEDSLKALKTDYIDLLQYHSIRYEEFANDELTELLQKLLKSGKARHLGNSISGQTRKNVNQVEDSTLRHVEAIQVIYNRLDRTPEEQVFGICRKQDLGVLARVPLASGFLSGKYKPGTSFGERRRSGWAGPGVGGSEVARGRGNPPQGLARRREHGRVGTGVVLATPGRDRGDPGLQGRAAGPLQRGSGGDGNRARGSSAGVEIGAIKIERVAVEETIDLRHAVLRGIGEGSGEIFRRW